MQRLTIQRTAIIVLFLLLFAMASRIPVDGDMWWHLGSGRAILTEGHLIYNDPFSHTLPGAYRVNFDWGMQVMMYPLWQLGGMTAMMLMTSILAVAGMFFVYKAMPDNPYLNAILIVLTAAAAAVFWSPRPQMATFIFTCLTVYLLCRYKWYGEDRLWLFVPLMLFWCNMHAGYIVGFVLLGGLTAGEILNNLLQPGKVSNIGWPGVRKLIIVGILGLLVLPINPYGLDLLIVPFQTFGMQFLRDYIQEWQRPVLTDTQVLPFTLMLILTPVSMLLSKRRIDFGEIILLLGPAYLALTAARNISVFAVVAAPVIAVHLNAFLQRRGWVINAVQRPTRMMVRMNVVLIAVVGLSVGLHVLSNALPSVQADALEDFFPVEAVEYMRTQDYEGEMFNSYNWGGYLIFFYPEARVFIDGRSDMYRDFVDDFAQVALGATDFRPMFDEYNVGYALIESGGEMDAVLSEADGWQRTYEDEMATIFVREDA
ncbi:hypothetical protein G4Y79_12845 [Phototrophicus methaneseepsis]|uniref:Glycosyltransferase RgtA/B/C/D-like domain-containing protein n=1 Tax=Phototrophicus methaneseepsis TaxID=2710758 RepID=A0A7S8E592_9CHLR|nr:hypothetical protein [Phototrophicus methaneseepsis]QPC80600.1 hypothetical protein G4Y79_12845 [Phototrophicus methaneseepsis]